MAPILPNVLAGPILRRADETGVWIWFALHLEPVEVEPNMVSYGAGAAKGSGVAPKTIDLAPSTRDDLRSVQIAKSVWTTMVRLRPAKSGKLPTDVLLGYSVRFTLKDEAGKLIRFWLHEEVKGITYLPFDRPTFFLSSKAGRVGHGSCRRPGAAGYDAHLALDAFLSNSAANIDQRPYALILTGDQIYADDVAEALFESTQRLARDIFGYSEEILAPGGKPVQSESIPYGAKRRDFILKSLGFTTDDGEGHLLSFAEFAAMYLMVWGPEVYSAYDPLARLDVLWTNQASGLIGFGQSVSASRRVMANVPTYMIFDDHEITDDWYFDYEWVIGTNKSESRHILANGLFAYWIFQGWGNDPDGLEDTRSKVSITVKYRFDAKGKYRTDFVKAVDWILSTHPWSYVPPIKPQTVIVNTRTQRQFPNILVKQSNGVTKRISLPSMLVGNDEIARIKKLAANAGIRRNEVLLLVVATPLFMLPLVDVAESIQIAIDMAKGENPLSEEARLHDDHELFVDNIPARNYFLQNLQTDLGPDSIVAFSGDVHHSFVIQAKIENIFLDKTTQDINLLQVTSSPIKNMSSHFTGRTGVAADFAEEVLHDDSVLESELSFDQKSIAVTEYKPLALKGPLGHKTFIPNNNFCVVDFRNAPASVEVIFIGMDDKKIAQASRTVKLKAQL